MFEGLLLLIFLLWILGFTTHIAGDLVHILIVLFIVVLIIRIYRGGTI